MNMSKMTDVIEQEVEKIANRGLSSQNIETAYKLVDMLKDIKTIEAMDDEGEYSQRGRGRYARRDSMGRYSRRYEDGNSYNDGMGGYSEARYMDSKRAYRNDHSMASKQTMLADLDEFMSDMHGKLKELRRDADTPEERETIDRYMRMFDK